MTRHLKTLLTAMLMALLAPLTAQAQTQTLTVYDGTRTSDYVPATISLFAYLTKSQFIIPADDLMEMAGGNISRMKFYTVMSSFIPYTPDCDVDVYLTEVDYTTFDHDNLQLEPNDNATHVYRDALQIVKTDNGGELTIQFSRPYQYKGGNLLVSMENRASYPDIYNIYFYGKMVPDASCTVYGHHSGSYFSSFWPNFIPKTTFTYTPSTCGLPPTLTAENITAHEATLAWAGGSGTYNLEIKAEGGDWTRVLTETNQSTHTLTNLAENSDYRARVRSVCGDEMSGWGSVSFSTPYACPPPTDLTVTLTEGDGTVATLSWTENGEATEWQICLNNDEDNLILANTNPFTLTGLSPGTAYTAKVRAYCNSTDQSIWSNTVAFTPHHLLTVFDGTKTDTHVPLYCLVLPYNYTKSQFVIPAGDLSAMAGGTISSMKFYTTAQNIPYTSDCNVDVFVKEVDYTTFPTYPNAAWPIPILEEKTSATIVCQDTLQIVGTGNGGELTISFSQPYPYAGGNLLVGMENTEKGSSTTIISFYGTEVTGGAGIIYNYNDIPASLDFIPKTTFVYTPAGCLPPQNIAVGNRTHQTADVSWEGTPGNYVVRHREASGPWSAPTAVADTNMYRITRLTANTDYEVQVGSECYNWSEAVAFSTMAEGKYFIEEGDWCEAEKWVSNGLPTLADNVTLNANATVASGCVAEANSIDLNGNELTIEDGGQLKTNQDVVATIKKSIAGYGNSNSNWYLIGFPTTADALQAADLGLVTTESDYDLYGWDYTEELEWRNHKVHGFGLGRGSGFLYANAANMEIVLSDTLNRSDDDRSETLDFATNGNYPLNGWNLLGNPFPCDVHVLDDATGDHMSFYRMNEDGDGLIAETGAVHPMEGFFVKATTTGQTIDLSRNAPQTRGNMLSINLIEAIANRSGGVSEGSTAAPADRAIIRFGEGGTLEKFSLSERTSKVYIPQGEKDYAVVNVGGNVSGDVSGNISTGEVPVHFKAAKDGEYTLSFHLDGVELDYLHLIDNMTGADVDLLGDARHCVSTYTFTAKTTDYASRFRLVFSNDDAGGDAIGDNAPFAYVSNGNIVITADARGASLQVIDMMGRVLVCRDASNASATSSAISTTGMPAGVYVLRLIDGEKVRTQKIVIE